MDPTSSVLRLILEAHLDHRGEDWTLYVNSGHDLKTSTHMTWDLFLHLLERKLIYMYVLPLSVSVQGPLGGIYIEWCDFCFQRGKFYKLCFTFISAWAVSSWENSFLLGKNGCEALAKTKGRFYCKENCLLLLPKKAKHMRQNHKYFPVCKPCENVIFHQWWEYFPTLLFPFVKIMVSMAKVIIYTCKTSLLQSNIMNVIIKLVE